MERLTTYRAFRQIMFAIVFGTVALAGTQSFAQTKVKVGSSVKAIFSLPIYVANANGYFKEEGIVAEVIFFTGGPASISALIGGSIDFLASGLEHSIKLAKKNQRIVSVVTLQADFSGALVMRKEVAEKLGRAPTVKDMKGLRIGTLQRGGFADSAIRYLLSDANLDPEKDVHLVPIRGFDKHIAAGQANQIDASLMVEPWQTIAVHEIGDWVMVTNMTIGEGPKVFHDLGYVTLLTTPDYVAKNRATTEGIVRALVKAQKFIAQEGNRERVYAIAAEVFPEIKPETLRKSVQAQLGTFRPEFKPSMITKTMDLLTTTGQVSGAAPEFASLTELSLQPLWTIGAAK